MVSFEFFTDPVAFLDRAGGFLSADPVVSTVVGSVAEAAATDDAAGVARERSVPRWWVAAIETSGEVAGVAMRTASTPPYAMYVLPMPDQHALELAHLLWQREEHVTLVNGALPEARILAAELARLGGGRVEDREHSRLFEASQITPPSIRPPGRLMPAQPQDAELVLAWFTAFRGDANEQAGRDRESTPDVVTHDLPEMERRIERGLVWFWVESDGRRVHLTGTSLPAQGVVRIGPVYTPPEARGRGYAGAAVALVSQQILAAGHRACLFTDQANPTSNQLYPRLGYRPLVDMGSVAIVTV